MKPEEKAKELFEKFYDETPNEAWFNEPVGIATSYNSKELAKKSAILCVIEILDSQDRLFKDGNKNQYLSFRDHASYWKKVKDEIEKL